MDIVHKPSNPKCYTPRSEPFTVCFISSRETRWKVKKILFLIIDYCCKTNLVQHSTNETTLRINRKLYALNILNENNIMYTGRRDFEEFKERKDAFNAQKLIYHRNEHLKFHFRRTTRCIRVLFLLG
jgi:hypothetical protein